MNEDSEQKNLNGHLFRYDCRIDQKQGWNGSTEMTNDQLVIQGPHTEK